MLSKRKELEKQPKSSELSYLYTTVIVEESKLKSIYIHFEEKDIKVEKLVMFL